MEQQKQGIIIDAAKEYMAAHGLSQAELATKAKVNQAYLSVMLAGKNTVGDATIGHKHWVKLAETVGAPIEVQYWELVQTAQFKKIMFALKEAREQHTCKTIIGRAGSGKTYAVSLYMELQPKHTYLLTMNNTMSVRVIILDLLQQLDVRYPANRSTAMLIYDVIEKLRDIRKKGGSPMVIFDEAENMSINTMKLLKGLYDRLNKHASVVLVGTNQLSHKMKAWKDADRDGAPQFYSRFSPGMVLLADVNGKYEDFFVKMGIEEKGLKSLLYELCEDYRELNLRLEPVIKAAADRGETVTEDLFRMYHDLPVFKKK